jgi:hypothetical protein
MLKKTEAGTAKSRTRVNKADFAAAMAASDDNDDLPKIISWKKIVSDGEKPEWRITIEGSNREMTIDDVRDITKYSKFVDQCVAQLDRSFGHVKNAQIKWQDTVKIALRSITVEQAPEDTTPRGQFLEFLETFLTNRQRGETRDDLLSGRPWEDQDAGRHEFEMKVLTKFLERQKVHNKTMKMKDYTRWIRQLGGDKYDTTIKGKSVHLWFVPSSAVQKTPELSTPPFKGKAI